MFRSLRNLTRLMRIALTMARHDALFPLDTVAGMAPFLRVTRLLRRHRPGEGRPECSPIVIPPASSSRQPGSSVTSFSPMTSQ